VDAYMHVLVAQDGELWVRSGVRANRVSLK